MRSAGIDLQVLLYDEVNKKPLRKKGLFIYWARMQPIRTFSEISLHIRIDPTNLPPLYQRISFKVKQLRALKMSFYEIAKKLKIHVTTALRAYYFNNE
jgi:predicted transcriptional regulator with HTH domain